MGPQPFGCGRQRQAQGAVGSGQSFNGAATFRLRKARIADEVEWACAASMGPQPFGCGRAVPRGNQRGGRWSFNGAATFRLRKVAAPADEVWAELELQWGRNLSVAEGGPPRAISHSHAIASMGPQPFGCGRRIINASSDMIGRLQWGRNLSVAEGQYLIQIATVTNLLQWGRNLSVAEGDGKGVGRLAVALLQWGRNLSVAEGRRTALLSILRAASMGPQPFGCGRAYPRGSPTAPTSFNGAATFRLRKARSNHRPARQPDASMGPQPFGCGRIVHASSGWPAKLLQWGRNLSVAEGRRPRRSQR